MATLHLSYHLCLIITLIVMTTFLHLPSPASTQTSPPSPSPTPTHRLTPTPTRIPPPGNCTTYTKCDKCAFNAACGWCNLTRTCLVKSTVHSNSKLCPNSIDSLEWVEAACDCSSVVPGLPGQMVQYTDNDVLTYSLKAGPIIGSSGLQLVSVVLKYTDEYVPIRIMIGDGMQYVVSAYFPASSGSTSFLLLDIEAITRGDYNFDCKYGVTTSFDARIDPYTRRQNFIFSNDCSLRNIHCETPNNSILLTLTNRSQCRPNWLRNDCSISFNLELRAFSQRMECTGPDTPTSQPAPAPSTNITALDGTWLYEEILSHPDDLETLKCAGVVRMLIFISVQSGMGNLIGAVGSPGCLQNGLVRRGFVMAQSEFSVKKNNTHAYAIWDRFQLYRQNSSVVGMSYIFTNRTQSRPVFSRSLNSTNSTGIEGLYKNRPMYFNWSHFPSDIPNIVMSETPSHGLSGGTIALIAGSGSILTLVIVLAAVYIHNRNRVTENERETPQKAIDPKRERLVASSLAEGFLSSHLTNHHDDCDDDDNCSSTSDFHIEHFSPSTAASFYTLNKNVQTPCR